MQHQLCCILGIPSAPLNLSIHQHSDSNTYLSWVLDDMKNQSLADYFIINFTNNSINITETTNSTFLQLPLHKISAGLYMVYIKGVVCDGQVIGKVSSLTYEVKTS